MPAPVISPTTSLNVYTRGQTFALLLAATELPPSIIAVTGTESTNLINAPAHGLADGMPVKFTALTWASSAGGFTIGVTYYVVSTLTNTFQLAATPGGSPINFTVNITAATLAAGLWTVIATDGAATVLALADLGLTFDVATGVLKGAFKQAGFYNLKFTARNAAGTSTPLDVPFGIEDSGFAPDSTTGIEVDVETGAVTRTGGSQSASATGRVPVLFGKHGSQKVVTVRFRKQGQTIGVDLLELQCGFKQYEPDELINLSNGLFHAVGDGFRILVNLDAAAVDNALGDYETDSETLFNALAELRWRSYEQVTSGDPQVIISRSATFLFQVERDIIPNP